MAVIYQISLHGHAYDARGKDWDTVEAETGCKKNAEWRDPILGRPLLVTEFGCAVSHLRAWEGLILLVIGIIVTVIALDQKPPKS